MKSFFGGENVPEMKKTGNPDELRAVLESMRLTGRKIAAFYSVGECVNLTRENIESEAYDMDGGIDGESREGFSGFEIIPDSAKFPLEIITEEPFLTVLTTAAAYFFRLGRRVSARRRLKTQRSVFSEKQSRTPT